jgi:hypothetical protein
MPPDDSASHSPPLSYAASPPTRPIRLIRGIGIASICIGALSLVSQGGLALELYKAMLWAKAARGSYFAFGGTPLWYIATARIFFTPVGLILGGFLLVIGIWTSLGSPAGRRLHRIYARSKIGLTILEMALGAWLLTGLMNHRVPDDIGILFASMTFIGWAIMGSTYPIVLLILFRSRQWRAQDEMQAA